MRFEYKQNSFYFISDNSTYKVQHEDIERLKARPGTRVLRFLDQNENMVALPLPIQVGEIEGYDDMVASI